jgi:DNA-binding transcriptional regulator YiaG
MLHNRHIAYFEPGASMNSRGAYGTKKALTGPSTFGERLRCLRIAWGWSQGRLAQALGSNQRLVSHWERDIAKPSGAAMTAISSLVGMTTEALLTGTGFTIPDIPAKVEGVAKETVAQYAALSKFLPQAVGESVMLVDINGYQAKPLNLQEAVRALKTAKEDHEVWVVVRTRKA